MQTVVIFGSTGGTGRQLTSQALEAGYHVRVFARDPGRVAARHDQLEIVKGDVFDPATVDPAVRGADAVLCALGALPWGSPPVCSVGTRNIIEAMRSHSVRRLICETAAGVGNTYVELPLLGRFFAGVVIRKYLDDKVIQEKVIEESGLEWVIVRPPRLTNGPLKGRYRQGTSLAPRSATSISRADVAAFMLGQLRDPSFLRKAVTISY